MPVPVRWFIKSAFVWLAAALIVGVALAAQSVVTLPAFVALLLPVYFHLFMFGWVTQLIFGVAYWMFPKYSTESQRGHPAWPVAIYVPLNAGLLLRAFAEPLQMQGPSRAWAALLVVSALLQMAAGLTFVIHAWSRVKER